MSVTDLAFTSVLLLAAVLASILVARARADARNYVQFAAALYAALALADLAGIFAASSGTFAAAVSLIAMSLAPASLTLGLAAAFEGTPPRIIAVSVLVLGFAGGIVAAATGAAFVAFAVLFASVCVLLTFAARCGPRDRWAAIQASVAGLSLLASAAAGMTGGIRAQTSLALFSAAALLGVALASAARPLRKAMEPAVPSNIVSFPRRQS